MGAIKNPIELVTAHKELEESIIREITKRLLKTNLEITETAGYEITKAQEAGVLYDDIIKAVGKSQNKLPKEIKEAFEAAGLTKQGFEFEETLTEHINYDKLQKYTPVMKQMYSAVYQKACTTAVNFTKTTAAAAEQTFISACDLAHNQIISGVFTYQQAISNAVKQASKTGSVIIEYESGFTRQLDSAVRSAVMTGINQTIGEKALMDAEILETDIMEITVTAAARPEHAVWQGRLLSLSGKKGYLSLSDVGYGTVTGIFGANCGHNWNPFIEGLSERAYTDEELEALKNETVTYNGIQMPTWKARDKQRACERVIRSQKRELVGYDEALKNSENPEIRNKFNSVSVKLKKNEARLEDFCKQTGLKRDKFREQVFAAETENGIKNWGRSVSQKAVHENKKYLTSLTVKSKIKSGEYPLTLLEGKQGKHIKGHNNYIDGKSYLTISCDEIRELVERYAGTGEQDKDKFGTPTNTEKVMSDRIIGYAVSENSEVETKMFKIHYSKKGYHIVPRKEDNND